MLTDGRNIAVAARAVLRVDLETILKGFVSEEGQVRLLE